MLCHYCNSRIKLNKWYGKYYYICENCNSRVGCHPGTKKALGTVANKNLRIFRRLAHEIFDPIWQYKMNKFIDLQARKKAYKWLAKQLNIPEHKCHIGLFNIETCNKVINLCLPYYKKLGDKKNWKKQ